MTVRALAAAVIVAAAFPALGQDACPQRGDLDTIYCDADGDLLADPPKDASKLKNPDTLFFTNSPLDDPAVFNKLMQPFVDHLASCTGRKVRYYDVYSSAAAIEAMRAGRMHLGTMSSGDTAFAVNVAGAHPLGIRGDANGPQGYQLWMIVRKDSPFQKLSDLKGKRVAHTTPSSNSGNLAPRALFAAEGLVPDKDYKPLFSGKHENSISGVAAGDYDAAPIAHDILVRMAERGVVKADDFRVIWKSANFAPGGLSMVHDLAPALEKKIRECTYAFRYPPEMQKGFQGADRWLPIDYRKDWELVRRVAKESGQSFNRTAFDKEKARAEASKK
ncbi:MAG: phosphate/phosphite/phosphonate ABC transporter substrate-binding protein [Betaproteobacteria bacterium]|nr:phosphate/phosphite/phosphonate ABC transporter substrate-binding protein [Betaproteobacteria bacterium]